MRLPASAAAALLLCAFASAQAHDSFKTTVGDATVSADLLLPAAEGKFPLVVVLPGSGAHREMRDRVRAKISAPLLAAGMAVLFYDNPGVADSTGTPLQDETEMANVTAAVLRLARAHAHVDAKQVALLGMSNGGWVAPVLASRDSSIQCIVLLSGPAVSPTEQELFRLSSIDYSYGASAEQERKLTDARRAIYRYLATGRHRAEAEAVYDGMATDADLRILRKQSPPIPEKLPEPAELSKPQYSWYAPSFNFDPVKYLNQVKQPTLALYGANDPMVNAVESEEILKQIKSHRPGWDLTVRIYPGAGHGLEKHERGSIAHDPSAPFVEGYPEEMIAWLKTRFDRAK